MKIWQRKRKIAFEYRFSNLFFMEMKLFFKVQKWNKVSVKLFHFKSCIDILKLYFNGFFWSDRMFAWKQNSENRRQSLCHSSNSNAKRSKFHNPIHISIINSILLIKNITSLVLPEEDERLFIIFGDFAHFLRIRIHLNIACGLYILLSLTSQLMYCYNYKNGINPTFLKYLKWCRVWFHQNVLTPQMKEKFII
jgi:hypothetical protein